jgi:hypothetical protein
MLSPHFQFDIMVQPMPRIDKIGPPSAAPMEPATNADITMIPCGHILDSAPKGNRGDKLVDRGATLAHFQIKIKTVAPGFEMDTVDSGGQYVLPKQVWYLMKYRNNDGFINTPSVVAAVLDAYDRHSVWYTAAIAKYEGERAEWERELTDWEARVAINLAVTKGGIWRDQNGPAKLLALANIYDLRNVQLNADTFKQIRTQLIELAHTHPAHPSPTISEQPIALVPAFGLGTDPIAPPQPAGAVGHANHHG